MNHPFEAWINLADPRLGARVTFATDEFFAAKERVIQRHEPVFIPEKYDDHGKWMDGWESRRKRTPGHDYCDIELGMAGHLHGVDIDTRHFTGNYPPEASLQGRTADGEWIPLLSRVGLEGDAHNYFPLSESQAIYAVRLHIYPDGGVARLRLYGQAAARPGSGVVDLLAVENGGRAIACNDRHYGSPDNLIAPGEAVNMGDGWETRRRRTPGHDWAVLAFAAPGVVERLQINTIHFKGNYPDRCSVEAALVEADVITPGTLEDARWFELLEESRLEANGEHAFEVSGQPCNVLRINIFPDGGISRFRAYGKVV